MIRIDREEYLDFLINSKDKKIIKVVSGVRRCGKSTLFKIYKDYLLKNGVEKNQIFRNGIHKLLFFIKLSNIFPKLFIFISFRNIILKIINII